MRHRTRGRDQLRRPDVHTIHLCSTRLSTNYGAAMTSAFGANTPQGAKRRLCEQQLTHTDPCTPYRSTHPFLRRKKQPRSMLECPCSCLSFASSPPARPATRAFRLQHCWSFSLGPLRRAEFRKDYALCIQRSNPIRRTQSSILASGRRRKPYRMQTSA